LPGLEISSNIEHLNVLKRLRLRAFYQINCDEFMDICESTIKESTLTSKRKHMSLLAEFIVYILNKNPALIDDYSQMKRISLKQYLNITQWVPVMLERPHSYPLTLTWQGKRS
jgi:hypothetical protein